MKKSIGIDVSMNTLDVSVFDGDSFTNTKYKNTIAGFISLENDLLDINKSELIITMEATGIYHLNVATFFNSKDYTVSIVNPLIIKRYGEMKMLRAKTDSVDARIIAEYGFYEKPYFFTPKNRQREHILQLLKQIDALHKMQSENRNRLHAIQRVPNVDETAISIYEELKIILKEQENKAIKKIREIVKATYSLDSKRLAQIPGVGERASSVIIGFFGQFETFENAKQVSSYIGINPSVKQSGISLNRQGGVSKKGE